MSSRSKCILILRAEDLSITCDASQVRQALTNLIQNAVDSVEESLSTEKKSRLILWLTQTENDLYIIVNDNGCGLPPDIDIAKLTEPYVTFKEKGTGLGLAIVKKIMEDHKGQLMINVMDSKLLWDQKTFLSGAAMALTFPKQKKAAEQARAA